MRIERISDNKIKVEISSEDIRIWNVSIKNLTDNTPEAQNLFRHALKQAEEKLDFSIGTSQLMVEAIPLSSDGFVMIISKINSKSENLIKIKTSLVKYKNCDSKPISSGVYKFSSFDDLCSGVEEIYSVFFGRSSVYKYNDDYYLVLFPTDMFGFYETDNKLSEFADKVTNPIATIGFLSEHADVMINEDAVDILANYFN